MLNTPRVVYLETRRNAQGGASLWDIIEFVDREAKERLKHSDVSIPDLSTHKKTPRNTEFIKNTL